MSDKADRLVVKVSQVGDWYWCIEQITPPDGHRRYFSSLGSCLGALADIMVETELVVDAEWPELKSLGPLPQALVVTEHLKNIGATGEARPQVPCPRCHKLTRPWEEKKCWWCQMELEQGQ